MRGVKGEMVVLPFTDHPSRFLELRSVLVTTQNNTQKLLVEQAREFKGKVLLKLKQIETPEKAKELVGGFIEIEKKSWLNFLKEATSFLI